MFSEIPCHNFQVAAQHSVPSHTYADAHDRQPDHPAASRPVVGTHVVGTHVVVAQPDCCKVIVFLLFSSGVTSDTP